MAASQTKGSDMTRWKRFFRDIQGQDVIEYTLLVAFVALTSAGLFLGNGQSVQGVWGTANSHLTAANSNLSPSASGSSAPANTGGRHHDHGGQGGHGGGNGGHWGGGHWWF